MSRWTQLLAILAMMTGPAVQTLPAAGGNTFWKDGNLNAATVETQSGPVRFVANEGLLMGTNREMVFGSAVARASGGATALYNDAHRQDVAADILEIMCLAPHPDVNAAIRGLEAVLGDLGWTSDQVATAAGYLNAFKSGYWGSTTKNSDLHNTLAKWLRRVGHGRAGARTVAGMNLKALGDALGALDMALFVNDAALGAMLKIALMSDLALARLDSVAPVLEQSPDPSVRRAVLAVRERLVLDPGFYQAFLQTLQSRRAEIARKGALWGLKTALKAAGMKGTLGVALTAETILSDWDQHLSAQAAVMAATLEEPVRLAEKTAQASTIRCHLATAKAAARWLYFDRMVKVCSVWQGRWVDALQKGHPYSDAKAYFESMATLYGDALGRQLKAGCGAGISTGPAVTGGCGAVSVVLLIDSSGSMEKNDPAGLRKDAASLLIDRCPPGTAFSIVDFDSSAKVLLDGSTDPAAAKTAARSVDANGNTDIEAALTAGHKILAGRNGARAAILFTDGKSDRRGGAGPYVADGIPVHVVGLGRDVDSNFLQRLAASTGGLYLWTSKASDLGDIFDQIVSELACEGIIVARQGIIHPGETIEIDFPVDPTIERLVGRVTWPGSRIDVELYGPDGTPTGYDVASGPTYRIVAADAPAPGKWTARLIGAEVAAAGEPFSFRAGGPSTLRMNLAHSDPDDPTTLTLALAGGGPRASVTRVWSRIRPPGKDWEPGPDPDKTAGGGWRLTLPVSMRGVYLVRVGLEGTLNGSPWLRQVSRAIAVGKGMIPWRGRITRVEGSYLTIDRGELHGVREGVRVPLKPGRDPAGTGLVISVERDASTVEVQELNGSYLPEKGMVIELDRRQWMNDVP